MQHTAEPWRSQRHKSLSRDWYEVLSRNTSICIISEGYKEQPAEANAQRIIDCVNGCAEIKNPGAVGEVVEALKDAEKALERLGAFQAPSLYQWLEKKINQALNNIQGA